MFSAAIAGQLRAKGHDALAVVADPGLVSLPDDQILAHATAAGRALVTANIKDFMPMDAQYRAAGQAHAGLILVSTKTFAQNPSVTMNGPGGFARQNRALVAIVRSAARRVSRRQAAVA